MFYDFLQKRFTVGNFNPLYMSLLNISIKNIYTTNIDDLFFKIFNQIDRTIYLSDLSMNGDTYNDENAIRYFPLHGCVRNQDEYVFGATFPYWPRWRKLVDKCARMRIDWIGGSDLGSVRGISHRISSIRPSACICSSSTPMFSAWRRQLWQRCSWWRRLLTFFGTL